MGGTSFIFFMGLAAAIIYLYIGLRRGWGSRRNVIIAGVLLCAVAMTLVQAANPGADFARAVLYGAPLGAAIGLATAAVAWYFVTNEQRSAR
jgi:hypothetical protein